MPLNITREDISTVVCDAIVTPTDSYFSGSGGADGAIHGRAGAALEEECRRMSPISVGKAVATGAYNLPCRHVIHTSGPVWHGGGENEEILLRSCYINALLLAQKLGDRRVALPLISAGIYRFPKKLVLRIALTAIADFLRYSEEDMELTLCIYDSRAYELWESDELQHFLNSELSLPHEDYFQADCLMMPECAAPAPKVSARSDAKRPRLARRAESAADYSAPRPAVNASTGKEAGPETLADWIGRQDDSFPVMLGKLIDRKGLSDAVCYKRSNVSKGTFWKIMNVKDFHPSKITVLSFAIGLELTLEETEQLLKSVGYSLSHSSTFDMILEFYIRRGNYNIFEINAALYQYDQVCLGC